MLWNAEEIAYWGKVRFPDRTEWQQYRKLKDQLNEYTHAGTQIYKDEKQADIYISLAMLSRFDPCITVLCNMMNVDKRAVERKMFEVSQQETKHA